jgi:hypothetical protein
MIFLKPGDNVQQKDTEERRRLERFKLHTSARILVELGEGKKEELDLTTKDVSSGGAFIYSDQPLPEGATVKIELLISLATIQKLAGEKGRAKVKVKGKVIRVNENGAAIRFDSKYKITALDNGIQD